MSAFILKIIALIAMTIDHTGKVFLANSDICNMIGRLAFPIFAFLIAEGYCHTKSVKKYLLRIFIVAVIAQFAYTHLFDGLNTMFTLFLGLLCILIYDKYDDKVIAVSLILTITYLALLLNVDYGIYGVLVILFFYLFRNSKIKKSIVFTILVAIHYGLIIYYTKDFNLLLPTCFTISTLVLINLYNNKRGLKLKYLFYIYYPLHLYIIWLFSTIIK